MSGTPWSAAAALQGGARYDGRIRAVFLYRFESEDRLQNDLQTDR